MHSLRERIRRHDVRYDFIHYTVNCLLGLLFRHLVILQDLNKTLRLRLGSELIRDLIDDALHAACDRLRIRLVDIKVQFSLLALGRHLGREILRDMNEQMEISILKLLLGILERYIGYELKWQVFLKRETSCVPDFSSSLTIATDRSLIFSEPSYSPT